MDQTNDPTNRTQNQTSTSDGQAGSAPTAGSASPRAATRGALIPDATVVDAHSLDRDGHRYVTACGSDHLQVLIDQALHDRVAEQLWFGQLCRASTEPGMKGAIPSSTKR
jgi:hypothetical protein